MFRSTQPTSTVTVMLRSCATLVLLSGCQRCSGDEHSHSADDTPSSDSDSERPIDQDGDGVSAADDCNDENSSIYPNAEELCNDIDDDCDASTDEGVGSIRFIPTSGTEAFLPSGSETSPSIISLDEDGLVEICGMVYAILEISANVTLSGTTHQYQSTIDGAHQDSVVQLNVGSAAEISNLMLRNGISTTCLFETASSAGGGVCCDSATLTIADSVVTNNAAEVGGGIYSKDCFLEVMRSEVSSNEASRGGGGIAIYGGEATITESIIEANDCISLGGGMVLYSGANNVSLVDSLITQNTANSGAGVGFGTNTRLTCSSTSSAEDVGIVANEASAQGGAIFFNGEPVSVSSVSCDWGEGEMDNFPNDIFSDEFGVIGSFGKDASFSCLYYACE